MRLPPEEIFHYALEAGFSPDQAVTMTAISLAESGGNLEAHNPVGEDSIGLWQVNRAAHPQFAGLDGTDPLTNARMAYEVSGHGSDIGRWTVTHADNGAPYLHYRAQAEAAARANGYLNAHGQWDPPDNYHSDKVSAGPPADPTDLGDPSDVLPADAADPPGQGEIDSDHDGLVDIYEHAIGTDPNAADTDHDGFSDSAEVLHHTDPLDAMSNPLTPTGSGAPVMPVVAETVEPVEPPIEHLVEHPHGGALDVFLDAALSQDGAPYIFGSEVDLNDPDPHSHGAAFDCSELVEWAAARAGVDLPDGSYNQYLHLQDVGSELTVDEALRTPGALVFDFSSEPVPGGGRPAGAHVAISLGNGELIEARGRAYGVGQFSAEGRDFSHAAYIPDLGTELTPSLAGLDGDVVTDDLPVIWDSDSDGLLDSYERLISLDPFSVDTDRDGFLDSVELSYGSDPLDFSDNPLVGEGADTGYRPPLTVEMPPVGGNLVADVGWEPSSVVVADPVLDAGEELVDRSLDPDPVDDIPDGDGDGPNDVDDTVDFDDDHADDDDDFYLGP